MRPGIRKVQSRAFPRVAVRGSTLWPRNCQINPRVAPQPHRPVAAPPMKFIHLTHERNIPAIRRVGLRLGGDPIGRGVNCVPLMWVRLNSEMEFNDGTTRYVQCPRASSSRIWRWICSRKTAAVIFEPSAHHWPAELVVQANKPAARAIARTVRRSDRAVTVLEMRDDYPDRSDEEVTMRISAAGPRALGWLVKVCMEHDSLRFVAGKANTSCYVIFRGPIPAHCITGVHVMPSTRKPAESRAARHADEDREDPHDR